MKLYHFTTEQLYKGFKSEKDGQFYGIQKQGLTEGKIAVFDHRTDEFLGAIKNAQWLTQNPDWDQSWDTQETLDYSRTEVRITVKIPASNYGNLYAFSDLKKTNNPNMEYSLKWLEEFGDPQNWYVYRGRVKPQWIQGIMFNPKLQEHDNE